jgi:hypothetical protein
MPLHAARPQSVYCNRSGPELQMEESGHASGSCHIGIDFDFHIRFSSVRLAFMTTTPELDALQDLCARLDGAGIAYMLTGSLAMSYYARPRMTRDVDLVIALEAGEAERLTEALGAGYHADADAIRAAMRNARPWNIIHMPTLVKIDLIPRKKGAYRLGEFERRRRVDFAGVALWIVSIEDLILSKLEWSRESRSEQQRRDVGLLLKAPLDRAYLDAWAARLDLDGLLKDAEHE